MLKTFLLSRPYAVFNASDKEHRRAYYNFINTKSWHNCPFQFVLEDPYFDLPSNINQKMVEYYMKEEFKSVARKSK